MATINAYVAMILTLIISLDISQVPYIMYNNGHHILIPYYKNCFIYLQISFDLFLQTFKVDIKYILNTEEETRA